MKKRLFVIGTVVLFLGVSYGTAGIMHTPSTVHFISATGEDIALPVMRLDTDILTLWEQQYNAADRAFIDPELAQDIQATSDYSILELLEYVPEEHNQGACSNCWAWPATAILSIALNVQEGIRERFSVQYINTCGEEYNTFPQIECCEGGNLNMFAAFYRATDKAIPWSNTNAYWQDGGLIKCRLECDSIGKTPYYPISGIRAETIDIRGVSEEEAINNIKNVLHQDKGVYFTVLFPDSNDLGNFNAFWRNQNEASVYDLDYYCGNAYVPEEAAGHALLCVGYHDEEGSDADDYWILLNSWGVTSGRPAGLLRVDMHMNYSCTYSQYYAFGAQALNVTFESNVEAPEAPVIFGPQDGRIRRAYTYTLSANDPQADDVYLYVDWDDDSNTGWLGPYASGEQIEVEHSWSRKGDYTVTAQAKDVGGAESMWSTLPVSMPLRRELFIERFIEWLFALLFPVS